MRTTGADPGWGLTLPFFLSKKGEREQKGVSEPETHHSPTPPPPFQNPGSALAKYAQSILTKRRAHQVECKYWRTWNTPWPWPCRGQRSWAAHPPSRSGPARCNQGLGTLLWPLRRSRVGWGNNTRGPSHGHWRAADSCLQNKSEGHFKLVRPIYVTSVWKLTACNKTYLHHQVRFIISYIIHSIAIALLLRDRMQYCGRFTNILRAIFDLND